MMLTRIFSDAAGAVVHRDCKRALSMLSAPLAAGPALVIASGVLFNAPWLFWPTPVLFYLGLFALDHIFRADTTNPPEAVVDALHVGPFYR